MKTGDLCTICETFGRPWMWVGTGLGRIEVPCKRNEIFIVLGCEHVNRGQSEVVYLMSSRGVGWNWRPNIVMLKEAMSNQ